jgi:hypothetical protein
MRHKVGLFALWSALVLAAAACGDSAQPTPTGAVCPDPDPMTFGYTAALTPGCTGTAEQCNFGKTFMDAYCTSCHSSTLTRSQRNGAPLYHDFDSLLGVLQVAGHIDEEAGFGPAAHNEFMPGDRCPTVPGGPLDRDCPKISAQERTDLAQWLACERDRPHTF